LGCLFIELPLILTEKAAPHNTNFPEYVLKMFYKYCGMERPVEIDEVTKYLSTKFECVNLIGTRGKVIIHAAHKQIEID
jgi:hypothetical protein